MTHASESSRQALDQVNSEKRGRSTFFSRHPLVSKWVKRKLIGLSLILGGTAVAIGGANLGTYFDYVFNNFDYNKFQNKTR